MADSKFDIVDSIAVFAFVWGALSDTVQVYPTENYYYFYFHHRGTRYAGNVRLDRVERDQGKVHFAYFQDATISAPSGELHYELLGPEHGVLVEKVERLLYRISYNGKSVLFALNDLSAMKPHPSLLGADDTYLGPVFDESAMRFFLIYNRRAQVFHYVLDETAPVADELMETNVSDRIVIGRRTGFAFYRDDRLVRKILIGVHSQNVRLNNYFDGPFDQLPDNFIDGEELRDAIVESDPSASGQIDRLGHYEDGTSRYAIAPYLEYSNPNDLMPIRACAAELIGPEDPYYRCFDTAKNAFFELQAGGGAAQVP